MKVVTDSFAVDGPEGSCGAVEAEGAVGTDGKGSPLQAEIAMAKVIGTIRRMNQSPRRSDPIPCEIRLAQPSPAFRNIVSSRGYHV